ncbi:Crp/Fnr family transcriptional regulator [Thalassospira profundimaris]|uniref:Crp/Fnr family transcriptional regulator n=1 Tax=Thalassospira profundimaris TaxID=502049 RepID=A0A367XC25_9PROT|nr:Crp/Fnr family transcriptional regulator [Thalassospira profundimaris]RCK51225.1 Crp/Fnr family transcriptional regulator [Thalassospira profundimaris]
MVKLDVVGILSDLDDTALADVEKHVRRRVFQPGAEIIESEGDSSDVFLILSGAVRVVNYSLSGREVTLEEIGAGGCVGHLAAIDGEPRSASVLAVGVTEVAMMNPTSFETVIKNHPTVAWRVICELARIVRASTRRIVDVSTLGANARVIAEIFRMAQPMTQEDGSAVIKPVPVHSDLASKVSTSRETVARVFGSLARQGIVLKQGDSLFVPDILRLEALLTQSE